MGLDWIPFRIDHGVDSARLARLVDAEWRRFVAADGYVDAAWRRAVMPRIPGLRQAVKTCRAEGRIEDRLLFKRTSHRVKVISDCGLIPPLARLRTFRTILPHELPEEVAAWQRYAEEARAGRNRDALVINHEWWTCRDACVVDANSRWTASAIRSVAGWVTPQLRALAVELERLPRIKGVAPGWRAVYEQRRALAERWNAAVPSRKRRVHVPPLDDFETWLAKRLAHPWLPQFFDWVDPWVRGGYGLYREE